MPYPNSQSPITLRLNNYFTDGGAHDLTDLVTMLNDRKILMGTIAVVLLAVLLLVAGVVDEDGGGAGTGAINVLLAAVAVSCVVSDLGVHATRPSTAQRVNDFGRLIKRIMRVSGSCFGAFDAWIDDMRAVHLV